MFCVVLFYERACFVTDSRHWIRDEFYTPESFKKFYQETRHWPETDQPITWEIFFRDPDVMAWFRYSDPQVLINFLHQQV